MCLKNEEETAVSAGRCPIVHGTPPIKLTNVTTGKQVYDSLYLRSQPIACKSQYCYGSLMSGQSQQRPPGSVRTSQEVLEDAKEFLEQFYVPKKLESRDEFFKRWEEVKAEVEKTGTYNLTSEELEFGVRLGWRNSSRCIARIHWKSIVVQDARHVKTTREMFEALCRHVDYATNGGNIRVMITVFPQRKNGCEDFQLWNSELIGYAGYLQPDGSVIGDPGHVQFTRACQRLGWKGKGGRFDILPWIFSAPGEGPKFYDIPDELVLTVKLEHPRYEWFAELGLEWIALPAVAGMLFDCGGIEFPAAPFNGWYMGTEIGSRDLCDPQRYNITEEVAQKMGLDTSTPATLWKDRVVVEVNIAVLHSYQKQNIAIVDHHTAAESFMKHMENEQKQRGGCPADWVWIVPPLSSSITPVFHQEMLNYVLKPSYEHQERPWKKFDWKKICTVVLKYKFVAIAKALWFSTCLMAKVRKSRVRATILYGTETGKSEMFAQRLGRLLEKHFNTTVMCMEDYEVRNLELESLFIVVTSTFGSGNPPDNGKPFWKRLLQVKKEHLVTLNQMKYGVFALGSSQYPTFCAFGKNVDETLNALQAKRLLAVGLGDELRGQEQTFNKWAKEFYEVACSSYNFALSSDSSMISLESVNQWNKDNFRTSVVEGIHHDICEGLTKVHNKKIQPCRVLSRVRLQPPCSERQTILVRLDAREATNFKYEPGDHLSVFPVNPSKVVNQIMSFLNVLDKAESNLVQVETFVDGVWQPYKRLPRCTVRTALSRYLDITTPPTPTILEHLATTAKDRCDEVRLKKLSENVEEYEKWKKFKYPTVGDVLEQFPSVKVNAAFLLSQLPLLQPRYYSISSSPNVTKNEVHLTMSLVTFRTEDGRGPTRFGVCTSYMDGLPHHEVSCFIRSSKNFRLPVDQSLPVIMVGAGSGIAPFRGFWQQREHEIKKRYISEENNNRLTSTFGKMVLFFGCRKPGVDTLYEYETSDLINKGVLHKVFYAFSRQPLKPKRYVQDILKEKNLLVTKLLSEGGHVYVCGDAVMADGVKKAFKSILYDRQSKDGNDLFERLMAEDRYHEDVFGVLRV